MFYENIGVLSADEIVLGGSYLAAGGNYWTFTPGHIMASGVGCSYLLTVDSNANLTYYTCTTDSSGVRPAVVLNAKVLIGTGGNGKLETPYVVNGLLD